MTHFFWLNAARQVVIARSEGECMGKASMPFHPRGESCFAFLCMFGFRAEGGLVEKRAGTEMRTDRRQLFSVRIDHFRLAFCERIYYNKREGALHETERYTLHQTVPLWLRHGCTCGGKLNDICPPRKTRCCTLRLVRRTACCGR